MAKWVQIPLGSSRLDTTQHIRWVVRVARVVTSVSSRACSNMADDQEVEMLACTSLVFCAQDLHQSQEQLLEIVRLTCPPQSTPWRGPSTRIVRVTPVMTNVLRSSLRMCCAALSDKWDTPRYVSSRHVTAFPYAKMHVLGSASRRDVTSRAKWNLGYNKHRYLSDSKWKSYKLHTKESISENFPTAINSQSFQPKNSPGKKSSELKFFLQTIKAGVKLCAKKHSSRNRN